MDSIITFTLKMRVTFNFTKLGNPSDSFYTDSLSLCGLPSVIISGTKVQMQDGNSATSNNGQFQLNYEDIANTGIVVINLDSGETETDFGEAFVALKIDDQSLLCLVQVRSLLKM